MKRPEDYEWSSGKAHLQGKDDILVKIEPLSEENLNSIRQHERTGRPIGSEDFLSRLEEMTGRVLKRQKPDPKKSK